MSFNISWKLQLLSTAMMGASRVFFLKPIKNVFIESHPFVEIELLIRNLSFQLTFYPDKTHSSYEATHFIV